MKESFADKAESSSKIQSKDKQTNLPENSQHGSLILEAIIVLGMVATFTPLLYKHVADRRADIENINRANTLLYLQQKTEEYLKRPENIKALVTELGHNEHKEIYPSELGAGNNFDGRYIIGIRREDEDNKPVLKAMIIDAVNTGSDLRAAKVAELIGISAGIYTAVDPDAAWGINGMWSEPLSRYFTTTNFPTGAVAVTTEYNKEKYRVSISDILVDADLDMGEFNLTAEQIKAINIAAENGTIDQLIAQDVTAQNVTATNEVSSPTVVATEKLCVGGNKAENCIDSWEDFAGGDKTDLQLVQECNAGMTFSCKKAFSKGLNTTCSKVDAVYDQFGASPPSPKIYRLTYGSGTDYMGEVRTLCEGTSFVLDNISTPNIPSPVEMIGDTAFGITTSGWYQITLKGEQGSVAAGNNKKGAGGVLIANKQFSKGDVLSIKGIKGGDIPEVTGFGGAGIAFFDTIDTNTSPVLTVGGGSSAGSAGGGYEGGYGDDVQGYSWNGSLGNNTTYCNGSANCNVANGGAVLSGSTGYGGTWYCKSGYTCAGFAGGNATIAPQNWTSASYGNNAAGYASITYCGSAASNCPKTCSSDSNCPSAAPFCVKNICVTEAPSCTKDANCPDPIHPYCTDSKCSAYPNGRTIYQLTNIGSPSSAVQDIATYTTPMAGRYKIRIAGYGSWHTSYGGSITAEIYYSKTVSLTVRSIRGGSGMYGGAVGGTGLALLIGGTPVLAAGGAGTAPAKTWGWAGGGGYAGGIVSNGTWDNLTSYYGCNWRGGTGGSGGSGIGDGGEDQVPLSGSSRYATAYGGKGYCASGYSCTGGHNSAPQSGTAPPYVYIIYCGPSSSSPCP